MCLHGNSGWLRVQTTQDSNLLSPVKDWRMVSGVNMCVWWGNDNWHHVILTYDTLNFPWYSGWRWYSYVGWATKNHRHSNNLWKIWYTNWSCQLWPFKVSHCFFTACIELLMCFLILSFSIKIESFSLPNYSLTSGSTGLALKTSGISISIHGDWHYREDSW